MGQISKQLLIKSPVEIVWKIWTDVENTPNWIEGVVSSRIVSGTKYGPGMEWEENCMIDGKTIPLEHKMIVWEEKKKTVIKTTLPMGAWMERIAEFRPFDDTTDVQIYCEWNFGIAASFIGEEKINRIMEERTAITIENLKRRAESF
jgi:uncharacterized membrane protein